MRLLLDTPAGFSFRHTILSHGWYLLAPFQPGPQADSLDVTLALPEAGALTVRMVSAPAGGAALEIPGRPDPGVLRHLEAAARRILNLDLDLVGFHDRVRGEPEWRWIAEIGAGRLLRGATGFEDLLKLVLTTNCSWALTTRMVDALVARYGAAAPDGRRAFPSAERLARLSTREWREKVRAGYRSPYLAQLTRRVARGGVDTDAWEDDGRPVDELRRDMLALPGVGPYVAENMLKLLGRPDGLALDSWMRGKYARIHHGGRRVTDRTIARRYARLGKWAGLVVWLDLTRDGFDDTGTAP